MEPSFPIENLDSIDLSESDLSTALASFEQKGALLLENVFPVELIEKIAFAFNERYQNLSKSELRQRDAIVGDRRYMITIDIKKPFNDPMLYANPCLIGLLRSLLTTRCRIASFGAVVAFPGAEDQPIHLDHPPLFDNASICDRMPPYAITVVVPLLNMSAEMGTTAIWPGTHRGADRLLKLNQLMDNPDFSGSEKPITKMGDAYMMDYRVIHGGMANRSEQVRPVLYLVYSRPWFRDGFNFSSQPSVQISKKQKRRVPKKHRYLFNE